jgi:hypothetical protein
MTCGNCGGALSPSDAFCGSCGAPAAESVAPVTALPGVARPDPAQPAEVRVSLPAAIPAGAAGSAAPPVRRALPGSPVLMGADEVLWRRYEAVRLRSRRRGTGTLYVTDTRIVFYAWAKGRGSQRDSSIIRQVRMADITGFRAYVTRRLNYFLLTLAAFFVLSTLGSLVSFFIPGVLLFGLFAAISILLLLSEWGRRGNAGVSIRARGNEVSAVDFGGLAQRNALMALFTILIFPLVLILRSSTAFDVEGGRPGDNSDLIIAELGALLMDLQTRGSLVASHWRPADVPAAGEPGRALGVG